MQLGGYTVILDTSEDIQRSIFLGLFEQEETKWVKEILKPGMTVVDIGSNIGYYSLIASGIVGDNGVVYAFDPSAYACRLLRNTIFWNKISNINVYNIGIGAALGMMNLLLRDKSLHSPSFHYTKEYATTSIGEVEITTLDAFARFHLIDHIDLVKIDVEGSEPYVIVGMKNLLEQKRVDRILIEYNDVWLKMVNSNRTDLDALIRSYGFMLEHSVEYPSGDGHVGNYLYRMVE